MLPQADSAPNAGHRVTRVVDRQNAKIRGIGMAAVRCGLLLIGAAIRKHKIDATDLVEER